MNWNTAPNLGFDKKVVFSRFVGSPFLSRYSNLINDFADFGRIKHLRVIFGVVEHFVLIFPEQVAHHAVGTGDADLANLKSC